MARYRVTWQDIRRTKAGRPLPGGGCEKKYHVVELPDDLDPKSTEGYSAIWRILRDESEWGRDNILTPFEVIEKL